MNQQSAADLKTSPEVLYMGVTLMYMENSRYTLKLLSFISMKKKEV